MGSDSLGGSWLVIEFEDECKILKCISKAFCTRFDESRGIQSLEMIESFIKKGEGKSRI